MNINLTEAKLEARASSAGTRPTPSKLHLLVFSIAFSAVLFLTLDGIRTARMQRTQHSPGTPADPCRVHDPVRYHALKPNCSQTDYWGADSYQLTTNSLGFRDEKIREVPLTDSRPRILILGDSFAEGKLAWNKSFVGLIAGHFPQYDFLNSGLAGYSPSNYLTTAQMVLDIGYEVDEVILFLDNSTVQHEAAFYHDINDSGAITAIPRDQQQPATSDYTEFRRWVTSHFFLTSRLFRLADRLERPLVRHGYYHLQAAELGDPFDYEMSAWTYRKVNEIDRFPAGYAPLGVAGGLAKQEAKLDLLWQELQKYNVPLTVVIYPHLAQLVHDTPDNRQVQILRQWCEGKCKHFVTVFPAFFAAKEQCPPDEPGCWYMKYFVFGDIHFSAAGNALVADAVIKSLTEDPPAKRAGTTAQAKPGEVSSNH
jgi:hypothetical protein